jgi:predicted murein hydrolase (TIGR00659 family)
MIRTEHILASVFWSAATIVLYLLARIVHRRWPRWWSSPLMVTPVFLMVIALALHVGYRDYSRGTHWLIALLGPATVAFAIPIYEQRALIRRYRLVLFFGVLLGSATAMASAWALATTLGLSGSLRLSLLPRSVSTPFAMAVSGDIGGVPDLTAVFVCFTGVFGAALGEGMLALLPLRSGMARGTLFGMGAHGAGVVKAHQVGPEEGSIAGLVMVLAGLVNVLAAPLLAALLR